MIHPWDAARDSAEWRDWLASTGRFGTLAVNNLDPAEAPLLLPTHVTVAGPDDLLLHLARPNPVWPHLEAAAQVRLVVVDDYAYIPSSWRAGAGTPLEHGVPASYYSAVQFVCRPPIIDDPGEKAHILRAQLADVQPDGGHAEVEIDAPSYGRLLSGIRGIRLHIVHVDAKFNDDDHKPVELRERVIANLQDRGTGRDAGVARQQRRRLAVSVEPAD